MKRLSILLLLLVLVFVSVNSVKTSAAAFSRSDYETVLKKSILFFDGNRCGPNVATGNVFPWRGACHLTDNASGVDITGGFHDAGDHVKFGLPAAFSASYMGWMFYEYKEIFRGYGIADKTLATLKEFTDYFLKCHPNANTFIYEVGDGGADHGYWGPPEKQTTARPVLLTNGSTPASDVLGNTAGALALMYLNYRDIDATYANRCLQAAKELYAMGKANKGLYPGGSTFYKSGTFYDDLSWAALWLYIAEGQTNPQYITEIDEYLTYPKPKNESHWEHIWTFAWDDMYLGVHFKRAQMGHAKSLTAARWSMNYWMNTLRKTPGGLAWLDSWGPNRYCMSEMGLFMFYYNKIEKDPTILAFAEKEIDYVMGNNPLSLSYVIGFGTRQVRQPHHRAANGWTYADPGGIEQPAKYELTGALVGGPAQDDSFNDRTSNYTQTEVALDYNASLIGAMTGFMKAKYTVGQPPVVAITAPANGAIILGPANVSIQATASDADGTIAKVEFYNGNTLLYTDTAAPYQYTWSNAPIGDYTLRAVATDNDWNETATSVSIRVVPDGPAVKMTQPADGAYFFTPANITLEADAFDYTATVTKVEFYNGTTLLGTDTAAPYTYLWTGAAAGIYSVTAKVTSNTGKTATSAPIAVHVIQSGTGDGLKGEYYDNQDFTSLKITRIDQTVNMNWAGGTPDPSIAADSFSVRWTGQIEPLYSETYTFYLNSDDGSRLYINNQLVVDNWSDHAATEVSGTITLVGGQKYAIRVEYYENWGDALVQLSWSSAHQTKQIIPRLQLYSNTGGPVPPTVSITNPADGERFTEPAIITVQAAATDSDGTITKVDFYNGTALLGTDTTAPYSYTWSSVAAGSYTIRAVATDSQGLSSTASVGIVVEPVGQIPPTVSITSPTNGQTFTAPANIAIQATAADSDGTVAKVEFYNGTTLLGTDTTAPYSYTWSSVAAGTYSIRAVATDNQGLTAERTVSVIVNPPGTPPTVSITSPANGQTFTAPASIAIQATAADSDGTVAKVEFYNGTMLLGTDTTAPYSYTWSNVPAGTYTIRAVATDNQGLTATSTVGVTVTGGGQLALRFFNANTASTGNMVYTRFLLVNNGTSAVNLSTLKLRYYYTIDGERPQNFWCDWSPAGTSNITGQFVKMTTPKTGADTYLEVGFASTAGSIAPGQSIEIQVRFAKDNWSNYTQTNDYSFNATASTWADWNKVTLFQGGALVFGLEP